MRHSAYRPGIAIALVAGIVSHSGADSPVVSVEQYVTEMQKNGWVVQKSENLAGNVTILLNKEEKGPEKFGLFRIPWDNRVTWKFTYSPQANNTLKILNAEGERMHKAPLFGKWKTVEQYDEIPDAILQKELGYGAASDQLTRNPSVAGHDDLG